jgi:hypothetical protein
VVETGRDTPQRWAGVDPAAWLRPLLAAGAITAAAALAFRWRRRAARPGTLPPAYAEALALLARERGLQRETTTHARDFARRAARVVPPAAAAAFWTLTEDYLAERFGGRRRRGARRELRTLRDSLRV